MSRVTIGRLRITSDDPRVAAFADVKVYGKRVGQVERFLFGDGIFGYWFRFDGEKWPVVSGMDGEDWKNRIRWVVNQRWRQERER